MEKMIPNGAPSLVGCKKLVVEGEVTFAKDVVWKLRSLKKSKSPGGAVSLKAFGPVPFDMATATLFFCCLSFKMCVFSYDYQIWDQTTIFGSD